MKLLPTRRDAISGAVVYAAGDTAAALLLGQFSLLRLLGMALIGATVYAVEIPAWFRRIEARTSSIPRGLRLLAVRTGLALLYFNPLWIARHLLFILLLRLEWGAIEPAILWTACLSWLVNIPVSALGNAVIQTGIPLKWRFLGSSVFSGLLAVYYAYSGEWFNG